MELAVPEHIQNDVPVLSLLRPETVEALAGQIGNFVPQTAFASLQFQVAPANFSPATPVKRRGKSMSRRRGQKGHIEESGKWYVVRFWMDVPGQEERKLVRERVCPTSGPGLLSKSERNVVAVKSSQRAVPTRSNISTRWSSNGPRPCSRLRSNRKTGLSTFKTANGNRSHRALSRIGSVR